MHSRQVSARGALPEAAMTLTATVATQFLDNVDRTTYTTGILTPTSGALYAGYFCSRTNDINAYKIPAVSGTNGWSGTWTRIPDANAVYRFANVDRGGCDFFWTVATSGTAGTITF